MSIAPSPTEPGLPPQVHVRLDGKVPVIDIPAAPSFEALRHWFRACLADNADLVGGRASRLDLGEREITLFDLRRLTHLLREEHGIEVTGLYVRPDAIHRFAERELKLKLFPTLPQAPPNPDGRAEETPTPPLTPVDDDAPEDGATENDAASPEPESTALERTALPHDLEPEDLSEAKVDRQADGLRTLTLRRTIRSGAIVRFDGDIYVYGDVNPGGQVVATGNIVVLGALKGQAHAGASGAEDAFILAFQLRPTQLRIARRIAMAPERADVGAAFQPELASVVDGQIVLEPYKGRLPARADASGRPR